MASGKPDWNRIVTVQGKFGDDWLPMQVDATGQLYIAMVAQEIDVTQLDSDRNIMGDDGGVKKYIAVDPYGVMMARLKGLFGAGLIDIAVDANGIMLSRLKGSFAGALKDIAVDTDGNLITIIQGEDSGTLRTVYVDGSGKMVARIQGATGGDLVVYVLDDCGDRDSISNWSAGIDALDPVESTTFVKEGSKSMELGVDASLNVLDYATWVNQQTKGDMTGLNNDKVKIWVWISTIDYLVAVGPAIKYGIGSGIGDFYYFEFPKDGLVRGWNELTCDLSSPDGSAGTPDWSAVDVQFFDIYETVANTEDFYIVVDSITVVRDNPDPGVLKDLNTDQAGFLLAKMVGSFGDYLKPLSCDRYGNLRCNPTQADNKPIVTAAATGSIQRLDSFRDIAGIGTETLLSLTGPGVILSGYITHSETASHKGDSLILIIDGETFNIHRFELLERYNIYKTDDEIIHLQLYDDATYLYGVGFQRYLRYNTSLVIQWVETVNNGRVYWKVNYANF